MAKPRVKKYFSKKRKHFVQNRLVIASIVILFIFLAILVSSSFGIFEEKRDPVKVEILDECVPFMNNLVHNIHDEGGCKIKCMNNCEVREMNFYNSSFTFQNSTCHTCDCYCQ